MTLGSTLTCGQAAQGRYAVRKEVLGRDRVQQPPIAGPAK
jgi:hypothetical protein